MKCFVATDAAGGQLSSYSQLMTGPPRHPE